MLAGSRDAGPIVATSRAASGRAWLEATVSDDLVVCGPHNSAWDRANAALARVELGIELAREDTRITWLRATTAGALHDLPSAQRDVDQLAELGRANAQPLLTRAAGARMTGDYATAQVRCRALLPLGWPLIAATCVALVDTRTGGVGPTCEKLGAQEAEAAHELGCQPSDVSCVRPRSTGAPRDAGSHRGVERPCRRRDRRPVLNHSAVVGVTTTRRTACVS